jgi:hypothetical protein
MILRPSAARSLEEETMADLCAPLPDCQNLDGRLLLRRAVYGPQLAFDPGPVPLVGVAARGSALRPFLDLFFSVRWVSKGVCLGPLSSIMGLAPGERVTVGLRTRRTQSFNSLFRQSVESSSVATHTRTRITERTDVEPDAPGGGGGGGLGIFDDILEDLFDQVDDVIELSPIFAAAFGSIFEVGGAIIGGALGGPIGAALGGAAGGAIEDLIGGAVGGGGAAGPGPVIVDTTRRVDEIVDSVERRESQSQLRQTSVSTTTETEETITRTFSNPYRDRSLELRFVPAFHRFDVITGIHFGRVGLAAVLAEADRPSLTSIRRFAAVAASAPAAAAAPIRAVRSIGPATPTAAALHAVQADRDEAAVHRPVYELLRRQAATGEEGQARVDQGLAWSAAEARGNAVHVPLAEPAVAAKAWGLKAAEAARFTKAVGRLAPEKLRPLIPQPIVRAVHVYAGTHVEAVPGTCLLPDIPDEHRIIVCCDDDD